MEDSLYRFCGSQFWDSNLTWYSEHPRFTSCFEKTVLVWVPCLFLWIFSSIDLYYTINSKTKNIPWNWRNIAKLVIISLLILVYFFEFLYSSFISSKISPVDVYTPLIKIVCLAFCFTLVILHRMNGQRSSGLMFIFWFLVVLFGFSQFYTSFENLFSSAESQSSRISYIFFYCLSFAIFLLQWIADLSPEIFEDPPVKNPNPEDSASFPSRLTFSWLDSLFYQGYKKPLKSSDFWSIKYENTSSQVFPVFDKYWSAAFKNTNRYKTDVSGRYLKNDNFINLTGSSERTRRPQSVVLPLCKAFGPSFFICSIFKLMQIILSFISPQLLKCLISFIEGDEPQWHGYLYAISLFIFATIQLFFMTQFGQMAQITGLRVRTALISVIYRKALKLSNSSRKESTLGEIVNLMAVDAQRFYQLIFSLTNLWSIPVQIILATVFLWQGLGPSVLAGIAVLVVLIPINGYIVNRARRLQVKQMKYKDERVKITNEILSGIKVLKLYAWESSFEERVLKIRKKEADLLKKTGYLKAVIAFMWASAPFLVSLASFTTFVLIDENNVLNTSKAFVSLALFNMLRPPLVLLPMVISNVMQASVSVKRINKFLNYEELDEAMVIHDDRDEEPLVIDNGTFSWNVDEEPTLHNVDLRVPPGSLVAVVGPVGSGKSSLISAFLGEMYKMTGRVSAKGSIAYVPQSAWIQNCTLQDNILFGQTLDNKRYSEVIDACALRQDLEVLSDGDQTEIGERGINLSGGQKQRVSLARAVYSDRDIYFLDDPLSAVDSHVGKHIFERVISSRGILGKKTRLLVSHGVTFLPEVDMIVALKDGRISEVGTYPELLNKRGAFSEFLTKYLREGVDTDSSLRESDLNSNPELFHDLRKQKSIINLNSSTSLKNKRCSSFSNDRGKRSISERLVKEERSEVGKVKWTVYSNYICAIGYHMFLATIIFTAVRQGFSVGSNVWLSEWSSDKNIIVNGTLDSRKRNMYLAVYGVLGAADTISAFFSSIFWFIGAANAGTVLHFMLLGNMLHYPMSFFETTPQGRIISRFSRDIDIIDNIIPSSMKQLISNLSTEIGTLLVITISTPIFIIVIIPVVFMYYFIQRFYITTSQQIKRLESVSRSPIYSHFGETVSGFSIIRAYNAEERFIKESEEKVDLNQICTYPSIVATRWLSMRLQTLGNLIVFSSALFSVIGKDSLSPGIVALCVTYALQITQSLTQLANTSAEVGTNIVAVERIKEYAELPQEVAKEMTPSPTEADWPREGKVEFVDYKVRYREGLDLVLKGITLAINGGEKVGIVGRTGAGKSSVTLCLFRILESAVGKLLIDGVDIAQLDLQCLRSRMSVIPQDPILFSGTLRINLDPFDLYSDEEVWHVLEMAHLKSFVKTLPAGLQHLISEGGDNISVGQRQLICLARVLLRKTKILILDEATAAVDLETDDFIQKTIRKQFAECTVLTIAHRIKTIMDSDRVLVLDLGSVVEFDHPNVLLKNKSSVFYSMAHDAGLI